MKKVINVLLVIIISILVIRPMTVSAATKISNSGANEIAVGANTTVTFSVSSSAITSGSIEVITSSSLEVVSGEWLVANPIMKTFENKKGAFALSQPASLNGNYFRVTVKGKSIDKNAYITIKVQLKNGSTVVDNPSNTKNIKVICATHKFSDWVTVEPTCENKGSKTRTCSVCQTVETQNIPALGHDIKDATINKKATCTETGEAMGVCSRCGKSITQVLPVIEHDWGSWVNVKAATCTEEGMDTHKCKACGKEETRISAMAKHELEGEIVVLQESTLTTFGIVEGTCKNCHQVVRIESDCAFVDQNTGVKFECSEGVFASGTTLEVTKLDEVSETIKTVLNDLGGKCEVFDISALLNDMKVQPNGKVKVTFDLPEGFSDKICVIYISEEGKIEVMSSDVKDGKVTCELSHFSSYAIVDMLGMPTNVISGNVILYAAIAEAVVIVLLAVLLVVSKKKTQVK